jgi:hypothetical protein
MLGSTRGPFQIVASVTSADANRSQCMEAVLRYRPPNRFNISSSYMLTSGQPLRVNATAPAS